MEIMLDSFSAVRFDRDSAAGRILRSTPAHFRKV
jgi:hypothetical protein